MANNPYLSGYQDYLNRGRSDARGRQGKLSAQMLTISSANMNLPKQPTCSPLGACRCPWVNAVSAASFNVVASTYPCRRCTGGYRAA